VTLIRLCFI